ncbi:MAG TPA: HAD hydrolase-like protein [Candidatus Acidoferrales bacterium]|jgi:HAD superfamily hydrolase (TIGR01450 family)|nr:HAD hydrolase-like protein [Candidatus Acidoferrales bacterium]
MGASDNGWNEPLGPVEGFMFDLDGTLILSNRSLGGYRALPGAVEVLQELRQRGVPFVVLTNGSAYPAAEQAPKLRALGLPISEEILLTPSTVAADLMRRRGVKRALVLGTRGVGHALEEAGIEIVFTSGDHAEDVQAVYIGWHPECDMKDIEAACKAIWNGAELYVASDVPFFATSEGKSMGYSHAIAAAVRKVTRAPMILTGKPSLHALKLVSRKLNIPMNRVGVVGDDPVVEMIMARRGKAIGFGVTTGFTKNEDWAAQPKGRRPHRVVNELAEILKMIASS